MRHSDSTKRMCQVKPFHTVFVGTRFVVYYPKRQVRRSIKRAVSLSSSVVRLTATVLTQCVVTQKVKEGAANPYADVQFRTVKNNLGVLGKRVNVTIHFDQRTTEEGQQIHNYWFNWAKADCDMLLSDKLANKAEVKAALDLEEFSSQKGYYRSKILGIEKGTASEVIEILNSDEHVDTLKKLKRALRIQRNLRFDEVEWVQDGGTKKTPLYDWKVKEGVDLKEIVSISEEEYMAQQAASPDSEELTNA
jgi:hypothetical protein